MSRSLGKDSNTERRDSHRVQEDRGVIEVSQNLDAEGVDNAVRHQDGCVNADRLGRRWDVVGILNDGSGSDQVRKSKGDACCHGHLRKRVEC